MRWVEFPDGDIQVCGLPWFSESTPKLWRFPERFRGRIPEDVFDGGKQTAGARLRFRTDSGSLSIQAGYPKFGIRTNMTSFTAHGISAYVDGLCWSAKIPGPDGGEAEVGFFSGADREMRDVCLYLPLYGPIEMLAIGVDDDASFEAPTPFAVDDPAIFYGTSITQGGCASRPGLSHQATVGRTLNIDYANYGFSGKGRCERELAEVLGEAKASCFVLDVGQNTSVEMLDERFRTFVDVLREAQPDIPLLATTPIFYNAALWTRGHREQVDGKREIIRAAIQGRKDAGDTQVHILEAADYHGGDVTDGAVDGGHPNDLGFARMAEGLRPKLAEILGI